MKYNIVDGHCDTPMELYLRQEDLQDNTCQVSLSRAQTLAGYVQFYAFCTVWLDKRTSFEQHYEAALSYFDRQLDKHAGSIVRCRTKADARAAILDRPRREWLGPIWRGLRQPGLRRKSAERALKLLLPRRWFGLRS